MFKILSSNGESKKYKKNLDFGPTFEPVVLYTLSEIPILKSPRAGTTGHPLTCSPLLTSGLFPQRSHHVAPTAWQPCWHISTSSSMLKTKPQTDSADSRLRSFLLSLLASSSTRNHSSSSRRKGLQSLWGHSHVSLPTRDVFIKIYDSHSILRMRNAHRQQPRHCSLPPGELRGQRSDPSAALFPLSVSLSPYNTLCHLLIIR